MLVRRRALVLLAGPAPVVILLIAWVSLIAMDVVHVCQWILSPNAAIVVADGWARLANCLVLMANRFLWIVVAVCAMTATLDFIVILCALDEAFASPFLALTVLSATAVCRVMAGADRCVLIVAAQVLAKIALVTALVIWLLKSATVRLVGLVLVVRFLFALALPCALVADSAMVPLILLFARAAKRIGWALLVMCPASTVPSILWTATFVSAIPPLALMARTAIVNALITATV